MRETEGLLREKTGYVVPLKRKDFDPLSLFHPSVPMN